MTMKLKNLTLAVALSAFVAAPAFAQYPVAGHISSDTAGSVAMLIKYVGTTAGSATTDVAVAANGDMTFRVAGVASTTVNSAAAQTCGAVVGTLDLSTPAATCNTLGEVVDVINATSDWRAVLVGALRSDSSDNTLTTFAVAAAQKAEGVALYFDSAVSLTTSIALIPESCKTDIRCYMDPSGKLKENPFGGLQTDVRWVEGYSTFATTGTFNIYSVKPRNVAGTGSETATTLWSEVTGASGTNKQLTQFQTVGLRGRPHEKVIVRITDTGASSAFFLHAYGLQGGVK
jgi:hypothetical protein